MCKRPDKCSYKPCWFAHSKEEQRELVMDNKHLEELFEKLEDFNIQDLQNRYDEFRNMEFHKKDLTVQEIMKIFSKKYAWGSYY